MKHIILAIDSFKGCLTSSEAGRAAALGVMRNTPDAELLTLPVSDGGEGMLVALSEAMGGHLVDVRVHDPLMRPIAVRYGITGNGTAIIEVAQACGLTLLQEDERDPLMATSFGVGELMADALRRGCRRLIVGLGGSATCDGGRGMLEALGVRFCGHEVDLSQWMLADKKLEITAMCDVDNPLFGANGSAHVYGPQKGASPSVVFRLDERLRRFSRMTTAALGHDCSHLAGAGAAGGIGFALSAYMDADLRPGIEVMLDALDFDRLLEDAALVITGEGCADRQTLMGKLPCGILRRARRYAVPVALVAGCVCDRASLLEAGFSFVECVNPPGSPLQVCLQPATARRRITATVARIMGQTVSWA